ncbi:flagellar basal body rod protein FlgB [Candidatus Sarmatiella mevalonica]|uniref:flagellar basal body rod protein FlgB n=1 Tax=Candidatus Sarmatiella mevalonica TaxID=2770581 RepID=UPI00192144CB|nr:flagellar basal body protein [Candidatus Sarmatiella mevalonica]
MLKIFLFSCCVCVAQCYAYSDDYAEGSVWSAVSRDAMDLADKKMLAAAERLKILSENAANVNTPGYKARDLYIALKDEDLPDLELAQPHSHHFASGLKRVPDGYDGRILAPQLKNIAKNSVDGTQDKYTKINGNNVSSIEQAEKIAKTKSEYDTALAVRNAMRGYIDTVIGAR